MYKSLSSKELKSIIYNNQNAYKLGLQGPDIFFYDIPTVLSPYTLNIGTYMHEKKIKDFFHTYILKLSLLYGKDFDIGLSYLSGLLCHYSLDAHVHPYVYSRTGYSPDQLDSKRNTFSSHVTIEALIDKHLLKKRKDLLPSQFYPYKTINLSTKELNVIANLMCDSINETYNCYQSKGKKTNITTPTRIKNAITSMKFEVMFLHDKYGNRKKQFHQVENILKKDSILSSLIVNDTLRDWFDACNINHTTWRNPWDKSIKSNASFFDLYAKASSYYKEIVARMDSYLHTKIGACLDYKILDSLLQSIGNKSYHSGLDVGNQYLNHQYSRQ